MEFQILETTHVVFSVEWIKIIAVNCVLILRKRGKSNIGLEHVFWILCRCPQVYPVLLFGVCNGTIIHFSLWECLSFPRLVAVFKASLEPSLISSTFLLLKLYRSLPVIHAAHDWMALQHHSWWFKETLHLPQGWQMDLPEDLPIHLSV